MTTLQDEVLGEYLTECQEMTERLSLLLRTLEKEGAQPETMRSFARDIHTIKGSSQLFGYKSIGQISHAIEECFGRMKNLPAEAISDLIDDLYIALDTISHQLISIRQTKLEQNPGPNIQVLIDRLNAFAVPRTPAEAIAASAEANDAPNQTVQEVDQTDGQKLTNPTPLDSLNPAPSRLQGEEATKTSRDDLESSHPSAAMSNTQRTAGHEENHADTIRVHVDLLDSLMNLVSELVLVRNQVHEISRSEEKEHITQVHQRLNVVTSELQNNVMKTRMQPVGHVLGKFHRLVRDLSKELGKYVELQLEGTDTELDKALIEAVRDPLTHIVRNAIDHGIESASERKSLGKPNPATIRIASFHESGHVIIEIADDGRGLNRDKIATKALEKGLVSAEILARLSESEIQHFIFLPGFSTADRVSRLSGRGVGMDVVKTNIEGIGGTVELSSCRNVGTTLRLKIPLTLAIIPALLVRVGDQSFAIPQVKLVELLRVNRNDDNQVQIEIIHDKPILRLRGSLLPLLDLSRILNPESKSGVNLLKRETINIVVLNAEKREFGLVVESVEDSIDIVVKPLASFLKDLGVYNGATLLGDGSIALTLDVNGLADHENLILRPQQDAYQQTSADNPESMEEESTDYLLVDAWSASPCAIPLCVVHRLEDFSLSQLRCCGQQRVIKYRDSLLPLISVREMLGWDQFKGQDRERIAVVVVKKIDRMFGLEVRNILDVIQSREVIDTKVRDQRGVVGSFIMGHEVVTVLDSLSMIDMYLEKNQQIPEHFPSTQDLLFLDHRSARARHHLLLVEDSSFFRNHVQRVLSDAGYHVTATINGQKALQVLDKKDKGSIAAIVSDIEMPVMGGLDFAREVRARQSWGSIPMIALSSRYSKADVKKGLESGFSRYIEKMNPDELIREVDGILGIRKGA